jgi:hypothetical protein
MFEVVCYRLQTFYLFLLCYFMDSHSWTLVPREWGLSEINSLREYRRNKANTLVCEFCDQECLLFSFQSRLSVAELSTYNQETFHLYEKEALARHNDNIERKKTQGSQNT